MEGIVFSAASKLKSRIYLCVFVLCFARLLQACEISEDQIMEESENRMQNVIVTLKSSDEESPLTDADLIRVNRLAQQRFLEKLDPYKYTVLHQYLYTPQLYLRIDKKGARYIKTLEEIFYVDTDAAIPAQN